MTTGSEEPRLRVIWTDPVTGRKGYAVIDRMVNGLAGGGTRMRAGLTLEEVERLARTMSYKNGAFNLPGGGAKGGVDIDPHDPEARGMLSRYVRAMTPLYRSGWGTAEDLGVTQELLNEVFAEQGVGMTVQAMVDRSGDAAAAGRRVAQGLAIKVDGIGLADVIGGYGVAEAAAAGAAIGAVKGVKDKDKKEAAEGAALGALTAYLMESGRGHELNLPKGAKLELELERALYLVKE